MALRALVIHAEDNVANLVGEGQEGQEVQCEIAGGETKQVTLLNDVPLYHKFALVGIEAGEEICKYGYVIGKAIRDIEQGEHVHAHNIESLRGRGDLTAE